MSKSSMPLDIRHLSFAELMSQREPFHMARYQRHYEWGRKEMEQLLEDLGEAFALHRADPNAGTYHFFGNIILFASPLGYLEVVDGQQRLTSLTLLIAAAATARPDLRAALDPLLFVVQPAEAVAEPRLHLHRGDDQFFREAILERATAQDLENLGRQDQSGAECLRANALLAHHWIRELTLEALAPFVEFLLARGRFVEIRVGSEDDAFRVFETVNNRGRAITSEDVLRFALIEYATSDPAEREDYLGRWDAMEAELGQRGMKRFINSWRARVTMGARPRQSLHRTVLDSFASAAQARAFLDGELSGDVSTFRQIETADIALPANPLKQSIDVMLQSLSLVDFDEWLPVVAELINGGMNQPERLAADLARVERVTWFYYLHRDDKGAYQDRRDRFAALMKAAAQNGTLESAAARGPLSAEQCAKMRDIVQERLDPKWVPLRSLLVRLEMAIAGESTPIVRESVTIEHILPLRPRAKAWLKLYDDSQRVVTEHAERIGNLCLVPADLNTQLGNRIYSAKRDLMCRAGVPQRSGLAADIATETEWTRAVIARRSKWLLKVFCDTFDVHAIGR